MKKSENVYDCNSYKRIRKGRVAMSEYPCTMKSIEQFEELERKLDIAVKALEAQPQVVYETLLETTAWMGIPEANRAKFIQERIENVRFIVDKALAQITEKLEHD